MFGYLIDELKLFLEVSSEEFRNLIKEKIWIISDENLNLIFEKIEKNTGYYMLDDEKNYYLERFKIHRKRLETEIVRC